MGFRSWSIACRPSHDAARVAVTGVGVVSALGLTFPEFWEALRRGESGIRPMTLVPAGFTALSQCGRGAGV